MFRDLASNLAAAQAVAVATLSATPAALTVDLQGYDAAAFYIATGVGGITFTSSNYINWTLQHSDDGTTYANVAATDINGADAPTTVTSGIVKSLVAAHATAEVNEIGYIGGKRYLQLTPVFGGTHATGTPLAAVCVKGMPRYRPTA
jgi:hypothetical protein